MKQLKVITRGPAGDSIACRALLGVVSCALLWAMGFQPSWSEELPQVTPGTPLLRGPIALASWPDSDEVVVANRCGTISVVDGLTYEVAREYRLPGGIVDLKSLSRAGELVAVLHDPDCLIWMSADKERAQLRACVPLSGAGDSCAVSPAQELIAVSLKWQRQLMIVSFEGPGSDLRLKSERTIDLKFEPGRLLWLDEARLVATDAFGGGLARVDLEDAEARISLNLDGHNLCGLGRVPGSDMLVVTHQKLDQQRPLTETAIEFGDAMKHRLGMLTLPDLQANTQRPSLPWSDVIELGFTGLAATDPGAVIALDHQMLAIVLGGVDQVSILDLVSRTESRVGVGDGPSDMTYLSKPRQLWVANRFSDTLSVIDLRRELKLRDIDLGVRAPPTAAERGERSFFDANLTRDRWMSCHSCHSLGHTSDLLADTLSDGDHGNPKRILSLLGVKGTGPWSWSGTKSRLAEQVEQSIQLTMHGPSLSSDRIDDLVAFLEQLPRPEPPPPAAPELVTRGRELFGRLGCSDCHVRDREFTSGDTYDVGLEDELGLREFNPPSLHGLWYRRTFFHDKRESSLTGVLTETRHQLPRPLTADELAALVAFLKSL